MHVCLSASVTFCKAMDQHKSINRTMDEWIFERQQSHIIFQSIFEIIRNRQIDIDFFCFLKEWKKNQKKYAVSCALCNNNYIDREEEVELMEKKIRSNRTDTIIAIFFTNFADNFYLTAAVPWQIDGVNASGVNIKLKKTSRRLHCSFRENISSRLCETRQKKTIINSTPSRKYEDHQVANMRVSRACIRKTEKIAS